MPTTRPKRRREGSACGMSVRSLRALLFLPLWLVASCGGSSVGSQAVSKHSSTPVSGAPTSASSPFIAPNASPSPTPSRLPGSNAIAPADATSPAAGICAQPASGAVYTILFNTDTADPRCGHARPSQHLRIISRLSRSATVTVGYRTFTVPGRATVQVPGQVGTFLAPGHHFVHVSAYAGSGPEILVDNSG